MAPMLLAVRKLDSESLDTILYVRCAYAFAQVIVVTCVLYCIIKARALAAGKYGSTAIYVPPPAQPFADPNAKVQLKKVIFGPHLVSTANSLLASTLFGICLTIGLHIYKGMIVGLAMQCIMGPLNLVENALIKMFILSKFGGKTEGEASGSDDNPRTLRAFGEKYTDELTAEDLVVDEAGNELKISNVTKKGKDKPKAQQRTYEDILLDTWDEGTSANQQKLIDATNKSNVNFATSESSWTPIMIVAALGATEALKLLRDLTAEPAKVDVEGWNALHWAAFHGSAEGARWLMRPYDEGGYGGASSGLHLATDKEGKVAIDHAKAEGNNDVAKVIEEEVARSVGAPTSKSDNGQEKKDNLGDDEGLRKRK